MHIGDRIGTFRGELHRERLKDGSLELEGEIYLDPGNSASKRQARSREKKDMAGQKRVEVWVPDGTQKIIRDFAKYLNVIFQ